MFWVLYLCSGMSCRLFFMYVCMFFVCGCFSDVIVWIFGLV